MESVVRHLFSAPLVSIRTALLLAVTACALTPGVARMQARWDRVRASTLCTTIGNEFGTSVMTIEHLMAAFAGCAIDNAIVEVNGPERRLSVLRSGIQRPPRIQLVV